MQTDYQMLVQIRDDLLRRAGEIGVHSKPDRCWVEFHDTYDPVIRRFAHKCGVHTELVDECAQEVWVAILEALERFKIDPDRGRFRSWLFSIVRNKAADLARRSKKAQSFSLDDSEMALPIPVDAGPGPVDLVQCRIASDLLFELIHKLKASVSNQSFLVFQLRRFEQKSVSEVSEMLNMSPVFVRVCHHRVEKRLSRMVKQQINAESD